jgi:hypothetical protein
LHVDGEGNRRRHFAYRSCGRAIPFSRVIDERAEFEKWYYQHYPYESYYPLWHCWQASTAHSAEKDSEIERLRTDLEEETIDDVLRLLREEFED